MGNFFLRALAMVKKAHEERSGNTNYFVICIFVLSVFLGGAKISNITVSTEEQQHLVKKVIILEEQVRQMRDDVKDIKSILQGARTYADTRH